MEKNYKTSRKIDLANAYGVSRRTLKKMLEPIYPAIVNNNQNIFFNNKEYKQARLFLPAQTKAIVEHLGECDTPQYIMY